MAHFYTRKGDDGYTGLLGEGRLAKYDLRIETVGELDEATAALGVARSVSQASLTSSLLIAVQRDLYNIMAEVAATPENANRFRTIDQAKVLWLEEQTDLLTQQVNLPNEFIVPGDSAAGAALALARTIVRRAERRLAQLLHTGGITNAELLRYLNRLSSLCFTLELFENQSAGKDRPTLAKSAG